MPEFSQKKLDCGGRDWHFDGPDDYWHKICDWENWTTDNWLVFRFGDWKCLWHPRFHATCSNNPGYGAHEFILRDINDDGVASACRLFPNHFSSNNEILRLPDGFENLICVCDKRKALEIKCNISFTAQSNWRIFE
ncbi:unnamed protein product [Rotaria socialis]|uniref:Uncharacterized protein n=1 Tax=Rotaria socialis TaxID=392032 RepID=A0A820M5S9_9BILA|nr:unnamed protein product [Rotaria socialis]CAF4366987.1 unnamed protein product [Rotaria socialis]